MLHVLPTWKKVNIKQHKRKHISPKYFYTHDLQNNSDIYNQQVRSSDNLIDLFTKLFPIVLCERLVSSIRLHQLKKILK